MSVVPINVGRPRSVRLVEELEAEGSLVGVVAQRDSSVVEPSFDDLYSVGTLARVVKVIRINANSYSVVLNGVGRFHVLEPLGLEPYMRARIMRQQEEAARPDDNIEALAAALRDKMREALSLMPDLPKETANILDNVRDPGSLADLIASNAVPVVRLTEMSLHIAFTVAPVRPESAAASFTRPMTYPVPGRRPPGQAVP